MGLLLSLLGFATVAIWFISIRPKADAAYAERLVMPSVVFNDDEVAIQNVRTITNYSHADFEILYETRTYALDDLRTVDFLVNYWGMDLIAHAFLSLGFADGEHVSVSIEFRPEIGESYDMLKGFFKQYELIYIWGDEKDFIGTRTILSDEDVYLYRTRFTPKEGRKLFISMLQRTQALYEDPAFYNTCVQSCTNTIGDHIIETGLHDLPFWKRRFLTGTVDRRVYDGAPRACPRSLSCRPSGDILAKTPAMAGVCGEGSRHPCNRRSAVRRTAPKSPRQRPGQGSRLEQGLLPADPDPSPISTKYLLSVDKQCINATIQP